MAYIDINNDEERIRQMQNYLRRLSRWTGDLALYVREDGVYGANTKSAVQRFQQTQGILPTGEADRATWEALCAAHDKQKEYYEDSRSIRPFQGGPGDQIEMGERSNLVCILKIMLNEIKLFYDCYAYLPLNHKYDQATAGAVMEFQRVVGLEPTGIVDKRTWNRLAEEYDLAVKEGGAQ
ncbi:MAG: peptidoglycan-binding protein [Clostridiales bacterium]|nr:peptidoglycan-binding protein [Clostridiales bacterium]